MKINPRVLYLSIIYTVLLFIASNIVVADALEAEKLTKVASNAASDYPVWSPDGREILFSRENGLYKVFSDGTGEKKLTSTNGKNFTSSYAWSPDGSKISYIENRYDDAAGPRSDLWIMNADGTGKKQLLDTVWYRYHYIYTWFPTGSKILYAEIYEEIGGSYWEMNSDGSNKHNLGNMGIANSIAMSPDTSKIAVCAHGPADIDYYIDIGKVGKDLTSFRPGLITHQTQSRQSQIWSPDGSKIVYYAGKGESYEDEKSEVYTIKADGTGKTQLTSDSAKDNYPMFSPDGKKIIYVSNRAGSEDIWIMDADGKNKVQLTSGSAKDSFPVWSPDGKKIAFWSDRGGERGIYTLDLENGDSPVANFSAPSSSGNAPLKIQFTDKSTGIPTSWKWSFGDGKTSTAKNPAYTYSKAGNYTVSLTVKSAAGTSTKTIKNYIIVKTPAQKPIAAFSATPTSGKAPLTVAFTDTSTGTPTKWKWNFGDGTISREKNPKHQYLQEGKYKITFTVSNAAGSSTITKTNYIIVTTNTRPGIFLKQINP
ncbi:PKD domain-containing protein [Methanosarcina sp.]|uniref:PKD domain-containing protein n=1 Tax=Methanosarcina sp. TaxID=2213 RepID=UPI0029898EF6|nr:PKD domain-containing protein [Methanosarcina sp.]MDW5549086.1 PKD domain-containing protein [Methanosarcina sp.]MDW5552789.1 PKD domain-containing protein [Methanosarcina sp.]